MVSSRNALITIGSLILLGAGIVTMSRAQQPPAAPKPEDRISREKHAALRAEVDLLQLQYTAASTVLQEAMKRAEELELERRITTLSPSDLRARYLETIAGRQVVLNPPAAPGAREDPRAAEADTEKLDEAWQKALEAKKKAFVKLATTLHEKSLELSIHEKQHEESR